MVVAISYGTSFSDLVDKDIFYMFTGAQLAKPNFISQDKSNFFIKGP